LYSLCFYDLEFIFRLWFVIACYVGFLNDPKRYMNFICYMKLLLCFFHNIKVWIHLYSDLPLCYMSCLNTSLFLSFEGSDDPKRIDGYYLSHYCCKCLDAWMIFLDYELSLIYYIIYGPKFWNYYDASMFRKELMDIICPINVASVWMPQWFF
jgi:hypothetical protein